MKREILNECRLSFPSLSVNESYARAAAAAFAAQADPTVREISEIKTAVSEAVTNAIVHGYRGCVGTVELIMRQYPGGLFYICVRDKGAGIQDVEQAMTPLFTTAPEEERSGLGFSVMESFMDRVSVKSAPGKGTSVTMEKRISAHARPAEPERSEKQVSDANIPVVAQVGSAYVKGGAAMMIVDPRDAVGTGPFVSNIIGSVFNGSVPEDLEQEYVSSPFLTLNLDVADEIGYKPSFEMLIACEKIICSE